MSRGRGRRSQTQITHGPRAAPTGAEEAAQASLLDREGGDHGNGAAAEALQSGGDAASTTPTLDAFAGASMSASGRAGGSRGAPGRDAFHHPRVGDGDRWNGPCDGVERRRSGMRAERGVVCPAQGAQARRHGTVTLGHIEGETGRGDDERGPGRIRGAITSGRVTTREDAPVGLELEGPSVSGGVEGTDSEWSVGAAAQAASATLRVGRRDARRTDTQVRAGVAAGMGLGARVHLGGDTDGDGRGEWGAEGDLGPVSLDVSTEGIGGLELPRGLGARPETPNEQGARRRLASRRGRTRYSRPDDTPEQEEARAREADVQDFEAAQERRMRMPPGELERRRRALAARRSR